MQRQLKNIIKNLQRKKQVAEQDVQTLKTEQQTPTTGSILNIKMITNTTGFTFNWDSHIQVRLLLSRSFALQ